MSRRAALWLVAILQALSVLAFAGWREIELRTGTEVVLATAPADPRDVFRGDHVVLRYEISRLKSCYGRAGDRIYVSLRRAGGVWEAEHVSADIESARTSGRPVIAGRVVAYYANVRVCEVAYGIESYFVPEGTGRDIERLQSRELKVRVVLDESGDAAIKGLILPR